jgi:hypothetical protein
MNVAFPALVVFIILLPGFILRSRFKRAERTSLDFSPFGQVVTEAVLWTCALHSVWLFLSYCFFRVELDVAALLKLLSSDAPSQARAINAVAVNSEWVTAYFGTLLVAAYVFPQLARILIARYGCDRYDAPLSFLFRFHQAPWYYLLTGADFDIGNKPDFISVSAVVNVAGDALLYTGILDEFFVDAEGKLDRLVLQQVMRRPISSDKNSANLDEANTLSRFYSIDGDYFVLKYEEAITLNIQYVKLTT